MEDGTISLGRDKINSLRDSAEAIGQRFEVEFYVKDATSLVPLCGSGWKTHSEDSIADPTQFILYIHPKPGSTQQNVLLAKVRTTFKA